MNCSLIVCTRNRSEQLRTTLDHLTSISSPRPWELVLVDNASTDATPGLIRDFVDRAEMEVVPVSADVPGLSRARNAGCRAASGEILVFTDDDCYPRHDYLDQVLEVFRTHDVGFMGGRVLLYDPSDAPVTIKEAVEADLLPPFSFPLAGYIHGANMAMRREMLREVGLFDEMLGAGTPFPSEDIEICARASDRGWQGGYFPGPTVYHHHRRRPGPEVERLHETYDRGRGAYYMKTLLDFDDLRSECLRRWFWSATSLPWRKTSREALAAVRYLLQRLRKRGKPES